MHRCKTTDYASLIKETLSDNNITDYAVVFADCSYTSSAKVQRAISQMLSEDGPALPQQVVMSGDYVDNYYNDSDADLSNYTFLQEACDAFKKAGVKFDMLVGKHEYHYLSSGSYRQSGWTRQNMLDLRGPLMSDYNQGSLKFFTTVTLEIPVEGTDPVYKTFVVSKTGFTNSYLERIGIEYKDEDTEELVGSDELINSLMTYFSSNDLDDLDVSMQSTSFTKDTEETESMMYNSYGNIVADGANFNQIVFNGGGSTAVSYTKEGNSVINMSEGVMHIIDLHTGTVYDI